MQARSLVRDYENPSLALEQRLPSLARRFRCLEHADGLEPWLPCAFYRWLEAQGQDSSAWYAGLLVLNLLGDEKYPPFDAIAAVDTWNDAERMVFANWARTWRR